MRSLTVQEGVGAIGIMGIQVIAVNKRSSGR